MPTALLDALTAALRGRQPERREELRVLGVEELPGGMNNALFAFTAHDRRYCAKLYKVDDCRRDEREWRALTLLADRGLAVAPRPCWHAPDSDPPVVVMEYVPGVPLSHHPPGLRELRALAGALAPIYALTPATVDYPYPMIGRAPDRVARVRLLEAQTRHRPEDPAARAVHVLVAAWLARDDEAVLSAPAPPVFARGDPNFANCLWDGERVRLIDFEYAGWGDLAFELADLVEGLWAQAVPDTRWAAVLPALGYDKVDRARFGAARRLCAVFWLFLIWGRRERGDRVDDLLDAQLRRARRILGSTDGQLAF